MVSKKEKINVTKSLLIAYFIMSALFILVYAFSMMKNGVYNVGVQNGAGMTVNRIIEQTEKSECQSFSIWSGENKVSLINAECVQQGAPENAEVQQENQIQAPVVGN